MEKLVEYLFAGGTLSGIPKYVSTHFTWDRFAAIQIWIFVLFLVYTSVAELNARLGNGGAHEDFFHQAFVGNEADAAGSGFARSSGSAGESRYTPRMSLPRVDRAE